MNGGNAEKHAVDGEHKVAIFQNGLWFLCECRWQEPFGFVESQKALFNVLSAQKHRMGWIIGVGIALGRDAAFDDVCCNIAGRVADRYGPIGASLERSY
jgi:hypothetical protein